MDILGFIENLKRFTISEVNTGVSAEAAQKDWRQNIDDLPDLYQYINQRFDETLAAGDDFFQNNETSLALFYMQWVSGLWGYGNPSGVGPGRVISNEIDGYVPNERINIDLYMNATIADCQDYSGMLAYLLTSAEIPNRLVAGNGHVFNEALIDGKWWVLDANQGLASPMEWIDILDFNNEVDWIYFGVNGTNFSDETYRDSLPNFRNEWLLLASNGIFIDSVNYSVASYYEVIRDGFFYRNELNSLNMTFEDGRIDGDSAAEWALLNEYYSNKLGYLKDFNIYDLELIGGGSIVNGDQNLNSWLEILSDNLDSNHHQAYVEKFGAGDLAVTFYLYNQFLRNPVVEMDAGLDNAIVFQSILDKFGIQSNVYKLNNYYVLELSVDDELWVMDLSSGYAVSGGLNSIIGNYYDLKVFKFDTEGVRHDSSYFDANISDARQLFLPLLSNNLLGEASSEQVSSFKWTGSWTPAGSGSQGWYVGDFNGDGKDDILRYMPGISGAQVFLSGNDQFNGAGSWTGAWNGHLKWYVGDFNGDGKDDILRSVGGVGAEVLLSDGNRFGGPVSWSADTNGDQGWYVGDFNGDGKDDIFRYVAGRSGAEVYLSTGLGFSFAGSWTSAWNGNQRWQVGDFNGDGKDDILRSIGGKGTEVFLSSGTGFNYAGFWTQDIALNADWKVGDFDGDGKADILRTDGGTGLNVYKSTGTSFEQQSRWSDAWQGDQGWYVGDFGGTGADDVFRYKAGFTGAEVFISQTREPVVIQNPDGFVYSGTWSSAQNGSQGWFVGDFNGDGKDDLVRYVPGQSGADVFLSKNGAFESAGSWSGAWNGHSKWYVGDFNGDGKDDLMRSVYGSGADVLLSNGAVFSAPTVWSVEDDGDQGWYVGDFNGDGKDDILRYVAGRSSAEVFTSNGSSFDYAGNWSTAWNGERALWFVGDFNGDGKDDILRMLTGQTDADVFLSTGQGFSYAGSWLNPSNNSMPWSVGDFDGDGRDDLMRSTAYGADVYRSTGTTFEAEGSWTLAWTGNEGWTVGDFDGNGSSDILRYVTSDTSTDVFLA
jgi:hypothetical protein